MFTFYVAVWGGGGSILPVTLAATLWLRSLFYIHGVLPQKAGTRLEGLQPTWAECKMGYGA